MCWLRRSDQSYDKKMQQISKKVYKTRHNWVEKMIHSEMCKEFKFDHMNKRYMHNVESVLENEMHNVLWDVDIRTDNLILARRRDQKLASLPPRETTE